MDSIYMSAVVSALTISRGMARCRYSDPGMLVPLLWRHLFSTTIPLWHACFQDVLNTLSSMWHEGIGTPD